MKAGVILPWLHYTNSYLDALDRKVMVTPSASLFWEMPFLIPCTFAFELNYQQRGGSVTYKREGVVENYRLQAQYVSLRVPLFFYFPISDRVKPYLFVAPDVGCAFAGDISLTHPKGVSDQSVGINPSNLNYAYFGALGGLGIRFNIPLSVITIVVKADAALNFGFSDTFSRLEHTGEAHPVNGVNSYYINGRRYFRGLEFHLSLGFFKNKYDACGTIQ
jgi:hypothetical protein